MRRPTVLHVVEQWSRPSERFVVDTVRSCTSTRAVVAAQRRVEGSAGAHWGGPVHDLSATRGAVPPDPAAPALATRRRYRPLAPLPVRAALAGVAVAERARVLHAHFGLTASLTGRVARRLGRPYTVSLHGWDLLVASRRDPGLLAAVRDADAVVVPSRFLADAAEAAGIAAERILVIPSGLDLAALPFRERGPVEGPPVVTFAGRFAEKKGVLDVARALALVAEDTPLRARFVGHGPLEGRLRALVADLRLDAEVVDGRPPGAVVAALDATDVAVTASRTAADGDAETLGIVNLEALGCGVPLVTTRHGGVPEAVGDAAAELVDEGPAVETDLAAALGRLLATPQRWAELGRAGRRRVATSFELGSRVADLEEVWQALAAGDRGRDLPRPPAPQPGPARVSVVLVTHDRGPLLERALDALAAQTRPADEVVVVDNGSRDGTAALLADRVARGCPAGLSVLTRPANLPVAEGRNLAVAASSGDVVLFTDDDCRPRPTWVEAILGGLREGVDLVQGRTGPDPAQPLEPLSRSQWTPAEFGLYETCNVAYRRRALDRAAPSGGGPFDLGFAAGVARTLGPRWERYPFGEDTELAWRVKRAGARSRFAVHAVVDHEVFPPDPGLLLRRAALAAAFPVAVQRVPELREVFLWRRVFLGRRRVLVWAAIAGGAAAVVTRDPRPAVLAAPYAAGLLGLRRLARPGRAARARAAGVVLARDLAETAALVRGSVAARSAVL